MIEREIVGEGGRDFGGVGWWRGMQGLYTTVGSTTLQSRAEVIKNMCTVCTNIYVYIYTHMFGTMLPLPELWRMGSLNLPTVLVDRLPGAVVDGIL